MRKQRGLLYNALLLIGVSLMMRTIGMYFNVYISNKVGAEAMGVYSLIGGIYGFGITLATSGINLAVTRLVSEALGRGETRECDKIMVRCLTYAIGFGFLAFILIFSFAEQIAYHWLDDLRTIRPLRLLAASLPPIAISSALTGYFTARRRVYKNALTVFIEQGVRIFCTVTLLISILPSGIEYACIALAGGSLIAELVSLSILSCLFIFDPARRRVKLGGKGDKAVASGGNTQNAAISRPASYTKALLGITLPVAASSYVRSGLLSLEHSLIPTGLKKSGISAEISLAVYGTLHSMVFPVLLFPAVLLTSCSSLLVPELAESRALGDYARIRRIVSRIMRLTLLFSIGVSVIMLFFSRELGSNLYEKSEYAGRYIGLLAPMIPIMYLDSMTDVMLKGLGQQVYSMGVNIVDSLFSVILVWLLLPRYGIVSYIFIIYAAEILNASLSIARLLSVSRVRPDIVGWLLKPILAAVGAVCIVRLIIGGGVGLDGAGLTYAIILSGLLYLLLLGGLFALERKDFVAARRLLGRR